MKQNTNNQKIALVTGANSGFGFELTLRLLNDGWNVLALIRSDMPTNLSNIECALHENRLRIYKVDLSDFKQLKAVLAEVKRNEKRIDILFNVAGVMLGNLKNSQQGRDLHFEINTLVPFILIQELKELLLASEDKTIVNTSSSLVSLVKYFDVDHLEHPQTFKKLLGPYATSKLALSLWSSELAKNLKQEDIKIRDLCPGTAKTPMNAGSSIPLFLKPIRNLFFPSPFKGGQRIFDVGCGPYKDLTGVFIRNGKVQPLKFQEHAAAVLAKVDAIYTHNFLKM